MTPFMEDQIKRLPTDGMLLLYEDVIHRIGSHVLGEILIQTMSRNKSRF